MEAHTTHSPEHATARAGSRAIAALSDIKIAHSVFALPFAILAAFLVAPRDTTIIWSTFAGQLALVVLAMVFARTWAMLVNRIADARFDADNPRTARRAIAAGRASRRDAALVAAATAFAFLATAAAFWPLFDNPWPTFLAIPVLAWIALYSFTKRFTALCHLFLGAALAVSPIAAVIAVNPDDILTLTPPPQAITVWLLAGFVLLWVAGFDVAYALQDLEFDRKTGLHSIPARLGWKGALWVARLLHAAAATLLIASNTPDTRLGTPFALATAAVIIILIYEHRVLTTRGAKGIPMAFFTLNGIVSVTLGAVGAIDAIA